MIKRAAAAVLFLVTALCLAQEPGKLETEGKRAFDSGRFQEAGEKYAKAAEEPEVTADHKSDLYFQSAWAYFIGGNSKTARENLKAAFTARPTMDIAADFYSPDFVRLAQAVRAEVAGPSVPPPDLGELKRMAREKLADGKAEEALYDVKRAEGSNDPQIHRLLAEIYDRLGKTSEADTERRKASDLERNVVTAIPLAGTAPSATPGAVPAAGVSVAPLLESSEAAFKRGDFRNAQVIASRALDVDPKNAEAHRLIADAAFALGKEADAEREYAAAVRLDTSNARAELGLAQLSEMQRKWNTAASHYRRALELNARSVTAGLGLGRTMEELKEKTAARIAFGRAVETDPTDPVARNEYGVFLARSDETDQAIEQLSEAVRMAPQNAVFHENLGRAYRKKAMAREAERELVEASRLSPNDAGVWIAIGHLRADEKRYEEAASAFRAACDFEPESEEAASGLGAALIEAGKPAEAEAALVKALEVSPKGSSLWNNLGVARTNRGEFADAVDAFEKAIGLDGNFEAARTNLARAEQLAAIERAAS